MFLHNYFSEEFVYTSVLIDKLKKDKHWSPSMPPTPYLEST